MHKLRLSGDGGAPGCWRAVYSRAITRTHTKRDAVSMKIPWKEGDTERGVQTKKYNRKRVLELSHASSNVGWRPKHTLDLAIRINRWFFEFFPHLQRTLMSGSSLKTKSEIKKYEVKDWFVLCAIIDTSDWAITKIEWIFLTYFFKFTKNISQFVQ